VHSGSALWNAAQRAQSLIRKAPKSADAWTAAGFAHIELQNVDYAKRCFERAVELAPEDPGCAHNLGRLLAVAFNDYAASLPLLKYATEAAPLNTTFAASYVDALATNGRRAPPSNKVRKPSSQLKALLQGLAHLPFTHAEQAQIRKLYREARKYTKSAETTNLCAATATWLWTKTSGYPLSISEVAAPFRAPVANVRALAKSLQENMSKAARERA
jgi:tetratricopeptide (TPR) repeat protein